MDEPSDCLYKEQLLKDYSHSEKTDNQYISLYNNLISRIGFNKQVTLVYVVSCLAQVIFGSESFFELFHFERIAKSQGLSINIVSLALFCCYISYAIGNIIIGKLGQKFGRVHLIVYSSLLFFISITLCTIFTNFYLIIIFRSFANFMLSGIINPTCLLATEYLPAKNRGLYLMISYSFYSIGILYVIINNMIFSNQISYENIFKYCNYLNAVPSLIIFILSYYYLQDSAIFLFSKGKQTEAFNLISKMISTSKRKIKLSDKNKVEIITEFKSKRCNTFESSYSELFSKEYFKLTTLLIIIFTFNSVGNIAITYLVPKTLELIKSKSIFPENIGLFIFGIIQLPFSILCGFLLEIKFLGRLKTNLFCSFTSMAFTLLIFYKVNYISILGGLVTILSYINSSLIFIYIEESYPTKIRDNATALNQFASNFITSIVPFIINLTPSVRINFAYLSLIFSIITLFTFLLPFETRKRPLDYEEIE